ncbi:MAG: hypothetical protein K8S18_17515, partial [Desulfobacula sp.]|nr:hypothetical protein [Desulfobacula sp.]
MKETEAVIAQSSLLLQKKNDGQSGELKSAGNLVENYIRDFLRKISPDGVTVSSGYVVSTKTFKSKQNLAQHDIVLSHNMIPPLFSIIDGEIDIVPVESMVGIIEVKRTLTIDSLKSAQDHILKTYNDVIKNYKTKDMGYNTVSITTKHGTQSPLFGIIGLTSELTL